MPVLGRTSWIQSPGLNEKQGRRLPSLEIRRSNPVGRTGARLPHEGTSSGYNFTTWRRVYVHHSLIPLHRPLSVP